MLINTAKIMTFSIFLRKEICRTFKKCEKGKSKEFKTSGLAPFKFTSEIYYKVENRYKEKTFQLPCMQLLKN